MKVKVKRKIKAPLENVWEQVADYANICKYHPMMKRSYIINTSNSQGIGATRQCDFSRGKYIREKVVDWKDQSHYVAEIYDSTFPIKAAQSTFGVRKNKKGFTEAYLTVDIGREYIIMKPFMYLFFKFNAAPKVLRNLEKAVKEEQLQLELISQ